MNPDQTRSKDELVKEIEELRRRVDSVQLKEGPGNKSSAGECMRVLQRTQTELKDFCYTISHDLRAPLRSLNGFSHILMEDYGERLDELALGYLQKIRVASLKMHGMIDDLLTLSRIGQMEMQQHKESLSELAAVAVEGLKRTDKSRQVDVTIEDDIEVDGDKNLLSILINNLLCNAWKFSREEAAASISFGETRIDNENVFFVRDNGIGFDMKDANKLFGPLQRLHRQEQYSGSGIGLAIARRIVERHHGRIWADAKPNEGATFYFTLG